MSIDRIRAEFERTMRAGPGLPVGELARRLKELAERLDTPAEEPWEVDEGRRRWAEELLHTAVAGPAPAGLPAALLRRIGWEDDRSLIELGAAVDACARDVWARVEEARATKTRQDGEHAHAEHRLRAASLLHTTFSSFTSRRGGGPTGSAPTHGTPAIDALVQIAHGGGGGVAIITEEREPRAGVFHAGTQLRPVDTLLEAILRIALAPACPYEAVLVMTFGRGADPTLPKWQFGAHSIRKHPLVFYARGVAPPAPDAPLRAAGADDPFADLAALQGELNAGHTASASRQIAANFPLTDRAYYACLLQYAEVRQHLISTGRRALLLVDARIFLPDLERLQNAGAAPGSPTVREALHRLPLDAELAGSAVDVVIFGDHEASILEGDGRRAIAVRLAREVPPEDLHGPVIPPIRLTDETYPRRPLVAEWPREPRGSWAGGLLVADGARTTAEALRRGRFAAPQVLVRRPKDPARLDHEFWAEIDLTHLRARFDREIIGQQRMKDAILAELQSVRGRCRLALDAGRRVNLGSQITLPAFFLAGWSGMGKTLTAEMIGQTLFGTDCFAKVTVSSALLSVIGGSGPPYIGTTDKTALMSFADRTGGTGVFFFDELPRVARLNNETVDQALNPLFDLLGSRRFRPAYQAFAQRLPTEHYELANVIFFAAGNVVPDDVTPPTGFVRRRDLGDAMVQRFSTWIFVDPLARDEVPTAVRQVIERQVRLRLRPPGPQVTCDERVVALMTRDILAGLGDTPPSLRIVTDRVQSRLGFALDRIVDAWSRQPTPTLHVGAAAVAEGVAR